MFSRGSRVLNSSFNIRMFGISSGTAGLRVGGTIRLVFRNIRIAGIGALGIGNGAGHFNEDVNHHGSFGGTCIALGTNRSMRVTSTNRRITGAASSADRATGGRWKLRSYLSWGRDRRRRTIILLGG